MPVSKIFAQITTSSGNRNGTESKKNNKPSWQSKKSISSSVNANNFTDSE